MRFFLMMILWMFAGSIFSESVNAAKPTCLTNSNGTNYFQYNGTVKKIYVNVEGVILIYFDVALTAQDLTDCSFNVSNGAAAAFDLNDNKEFAQLFYSTALAAQASGRPVSMQLYGTESGYPKFDRIWLAE